jgi:hypothetical protein
MYTADGSTGPRLVLVVFTLRKKIELTGVHSFRSAGVFLATGVHSARSAGAFCATGVGSGP